MTETLKCYRVWMNDGYAGLYDAVSETEARRKAVEWAHESLRSCKADPNHPKNRDAVSVDYAECLDD